MRVIEPPFHCQGNVYRTGWLLVVCWQIAKSLNLGKPLDDSAEDHILVVKVAEGCSSSYVKLGFICVLESAAFAHANQA